ncbi:hypothetical protein BX600DRAFT_505090 [Xylariales sp. PMI_506]|nr:hypothetical protein BX600DRAFT_505090 [Xylariales sp. PMI_506]
MDPSEGPPPGADDHKPDEPSPTNDKGDDDQTPKKAAVRKRTKTGCLTCRKRRIKCDEARPTCGNCIKSKRQCEGYNPRVVFKEPHVAYAPFGQMMYGTLPPPLVREQVSAAQQKATSQSLQFIAPKPPQPGYMAGTAPFFNNAIPGSAAPVASPPMNLDPSFYGVGQAQPRAKYASFSSESGESALSSGQWRHDSQILEQQQLDFSQYMPKLSEEDLLAQNTSPTVPHHQPQIQQVDANTVVQDGVDVNQIIDPHFVEWQSEYYDVDDDASMGESDDDLPATQGQNGAPGQLDELGLIVSRKLHDRHGAFGTTEPRTFAFHADYVLTTYEPSPNTSPLRDKRIRAVFWHFVNVTGPSISLYERHPLDGLLLYHQGPHFKSRQHIWTYTFPALSLTHPALLQAILALGSLQIAKLQLVPPTASLKHYHLALRRIARNIGRPSKRAEPSNLAATLLLAYYEVWNSDHEKWSKHLLGARLIIKDIPFPEMTRTMMDIKRRLRQQREQEERERQENAASDSADDGPMTSFGVYDHLHSHADTTHAESEHLYADWDMIDVPLLREITGQPISYEYLGMIPEEVSGYPRIRGQFTEKDKNTYEQLSDLFWWYAKMDVYQSVLGGTKLFMEYRLWTQCAPRAPMGRLDAVYGTFDHVILLLARLTNFSSRDLVRKRRVFSLRGTFGPSGAPPGTFPGMMPRSGRVQHPLGFSPPREEASPDTDSIDDQDLPAMTAEAHREWQSIKAAFEKLREHFGPEFEPLSDDLYPPSYSPFGPALRYRTYSIAGIWMNYLMGLVVLHRAHPEMPPVAMMAAGMSANETMEYALQIARIADGLEENVSMITEVSTLVGAALIESAFCCFVAAVQYQAPDQRTWLIRRLHDIARLTGWQSARQIADGCESAWTKAAARGRGPPYVRDPSINLDALPPTVGLPRRIDRRIREVVHDDADGKGGIDRLILGKEEKAHYAIGLLGMQEDLEKLDLESGERDE